MVNIMGYFDDAIAEREESLEHGDFSGSDIIELSEEEYLEHGRFGSFRKTHKYIDRVWKGGRWVYRYAKKAAKDTAGKLTGDYYKNEAEKHEKDADRYSHMASKHFVNATKDAAKKRTPEEERRYDEYWQKERDMMDHYMDREIESESAARKARRKAENAPLKKVKDFFTPKETATVKDTMTGKTKSVDPNDAIYKKLEKEAKKSKKFKHDDEDGEIMTYFPARDENSLEHHGILGQKWGIRRFQNADGSLTAEGKKRVSEGTEGVRKTLEEGKNEVTRRKTIGSIKAAAGAIGTVAGSTAAGAGIGALTGGPAGAVVGGYAGYMTGIIPAGIASYFIQKHADAKADALDEQTVLLGHKMMEEIKHVKIDDIPSGKSTSDGSDDESRARAAAKKASLEKAKSTGQYSLDFLEAVQNSKILSQGNDKALLKEYEKYLNDPDDYWKNGRNKLEEE